MPARKISLRSKHGSPRSGSPLERGSTNSEERTLLSFSLVYASPRASESAHQQGEELDPSAKEKKGDPLPAITQPSNFLLDPARQKMVMEFSYDLLREQLVKEVRKDLEKDRPTGKKAYTEEVDKEPREEVVKFNQQLESRFDALKKEFDEYKKLSKQERLLGAKDPKVGEEKGGEEVNNPIGVLAGQERELDHPKKRSQKRGNWVSKSNPVVSQQSPATQSGKKGLKDCGCIIL